MQTIFALFYNKINYLFIFIREDRVRKTVIFFDIKEAYPEPCQDGGFLKIVNAQQPLTSFTKRTKLDLW